LIRNVLDGADDSTDLVGAGPQALDGLGRLPDPLRYLLIIALSSTIRHLMSHPPKRSGVGQFAGELPRCLYELQFIQKLNI
jgi:hypothetical protein